MTLFPELFPTPQKPDFDGETYQAVRDQDRLHAQLTKVKAILLDGEAHTLAELSSLTGAPEASVSARIRDLRKPKFGGHVIARTYVADGLWDYRLITEG